MGWTNYLNIDDTEAKASKYGRLHTWTTNANNQSGFYVVSRCIADGGGGYDGKGDYTYICTASEVSGSSAVFPPGGEVCEIGGGIYPSG